MKNTILSVLVLLLTSSYSFCQTIDGIECGSDIDTFKDPEIEYMDTIMVHKWVKVEKPIGSFHGFPVAYENYLFRSDQFVGKVFSLSGQRNLIELYRKLNNDLDTEIEKIEAYDFSNFYKSTNSDNSMSFVTPKEVILLRRYSVHLGLAILFCKDIWQQKRDQYIKDNK